jgi:GTP-binding protein HflX
MSQKVGGETRGLAPSLIRKVHKLYTRQLDPEDLVPLEFAHELYEVADSISRRVGVLVSREGRVEQVFIGSKDILYLPDLGRYRFSAGRLRRLRLIFSDLSSKAEDPQLPGDIITDLEKLRLDAVVAVKATRGGIGLRYAHLLPEGGHEEYVVRSLSRDGVDFRSLIEELEAQIARTLQAQRHREPDDRRAVLVSVSDRPSTEVQASLDELTELCRTAGVAVADTMYQRKKPDPKSVLGKGKLEEVVLHCLRVGAGILIFDTELRPAQWRTITNATDLKVLDRSMVILDIFAQRATSAEGRLQVELAQLTYNLPRLVERDSGLSRLTGGIGGRGPGETKLEIGRRRARDRITLLKKRLEEVTGQRTIRRQRRLSSEIPLLAIVGYTNVGKSTLFNRLTGDSVLAEDKLFATLTPFQRRIALPPRIDTTDEDRRVIISDTVGFIRELPRELLPAFRATLEEIEGAALVVHVVDGSDSRALEHYHAVQEIFTSFGFNERHEVVVVNKVDAADPEAVEHLIADLDAVAISAHSGFGIGELRLRLRSALEQLAVSGGEETEE